MFYDPERKRYFADWRDRKGTRHRKAFTSAKAAGAYEAEQKNQNPKVRAMRSRRAASSSMRTRGGQGKSSNTSKRSSQWSGTHRQTASAKRRSKK